MQMNKRKLYIARGIVKGFARSAHQTCSLTTLGVMCSVVVKLLYLCLKILLSSVTAIRHSTLLSNVQINMQ